jgi:hypothetical protein
MSQADGSSAAVKSIGDVALQATAANDTPIWPLGNRLKEQVETVRMGISRHEDQATIC